MTARMTRCFALAAVLVSVGAPASAQILGGVGRGAGLDLPSLEGPASIVGAAGDQALSDARDLPDARRLTELRRDAMRALVRNNPRQVDVDAAGAPVVRGEILALSPSARALDAATRAGFAIVRRAKLDPIGLDLVVLSPPAGVSTQEGVKQLRKADPLGQYDFDHLYAPSGVGEAAPAAGHPDAAIPKPAARVRIGLLDTGIAGGLPVFAGSVIEQRGFAPGGVRSGAHGTAVASLMVGRVRHFAGAAPGAGLLAADVYGDGPTGGSAAAIVQALAWMVDNRVPVINISLVGPANLTLQAGVTAVLAHGEAIVAPVGNDGPAAPPLYPASYPGVIAVTGVDRQGRVLFEAGRATHLDFAAPGSEIVAATPGGGFAPVRGTSFAAPIVAGRLALLMPSPGRETLAKAVAWLAVHADRSGNPAYGRGLIGQDLRASQR